MALLNRLWLHKTVVVVIVLYLLSYQTDHHLAKTLFDAMVFFGLFTLVPHFRVMMQEKTLLLFSVATVGFALIALISSVANETPWFSEELRRIIHAAGGLLMIPLLGAVSLRTRTFYIAISVATIGCGIYALVELWQHGLGYRVGGSRGKPIVFGDTVLLMGLIAACGGFLSESKKFLLLRVLPVLALVSGLTVSYFSGSRGGWVFLPVALIVYLIALRDHPRFRKAVSWVLVLIIVVTTTVIVYQPQKAARLPVGVEELADYVGSDGRTRMNSVSIRLELWDIAWQAFRESPWLGVGTASFREYLHGLSTHKEIPARLAHYQHAHSQYLNTLATNGLFAELALLGMFLVPLWFYGGTIKKATSEELPLLASGMLATLGYMVFCVTDSFFFVSEAFVFYMVLQAILMTAVVRLRKENAAVRVETR